MDSIVVTGNGPLHGQIAIAGAKNACLTLMPATLLSEEPLTLTNAPRLSDIRTMSTLLESLGAEVAQMQGGQVLALASHAITNHRADYDIVRKMRASILVLGPMLAREGHAVVSLPGGCAIGARPVDLHLHALEAMGAELDLRDGYVHARAPGGLRGGRIAFPMVSVGATENALMAATLARGTTVIDNAAREPEIVDLAQCLRKMGAQIEGHGTSRIRIQGVATLHGCTHQVVADRIEAGTFMVASAITRGDVRLQGVIPAHLEAVIARRSADDAAVDDAFDAVAEAFERYEDALDSAFGESLPLVLDDDLNESYDDDDPEDDDEDDEDDPEDLEPEGIDGHAVENEDEMDDDIEAFDLR